MKKFIVIDGLDGSGKDTQVNLIAEAYQKKGRDVTIRSHPCNDNKFGRKSKAALLKTGKLNHIKATIYFGLDAIRSVQMYCHNRNTDVVIFSRYILAVMYLPNVVNTIVYKIVAFVLPTSDCMFFLDITPEESLRRIGSRDEETEMFENIESLTENRERSRKFTYNWNVVSADDAPDVISEKIIAKCFETD
ncbi:MULTISPECIES: nucleoside/nucleotide kinase family protein [Methanobrevibacter]|uniref:dTMP kinase n=1 Tax=Methanobrevibacter thaueri TaxID=190975 RepID=A0A315XPB6_9EURY|nr:MULTISPECIES: thymidylate kinase [Methanobrevibacter]MBR2665237.1 thymidylate kinase [Methanobrevibacter sp.]MBR3198186.1 thymidylate kinase [Methanobrevibacter sp.]MBR7050400.1 thymidylate kinase [Methanobrevibacter sp.]PWB87714.1 thymidylate kinase [Methanobrevibacter thaueri]